MIMTTDQNATDCHLPNLCSDDELTITVICEVGQFVIKLSAVHFEYKKNKSHGKYFKRSKSYWLTKLKTAVELTAPVHKVVNFCNGIFVLF